MAYHQSDDAVATEAQSLLRMAPLLANKNNVAKHKLSGSRVWVLALTVALVGCFGCFGFRASRASSSPTSLVGSGNAVSPYTLVAACQIRPERSTMFERALRSWLALPANLVERIVVVDWFSESNLVNVVKKELAAAPDGKGREEM